MSDGRPDGDVVPGGLPAAAAADPWPGDPVEIEEAAPAGDERADRRRELEAILFVADEPVEVALLAEALGWYRGAVEDLLVELAAEYAADGRGFVLRAVGGGWRLYTHPAAADAVAAFVRHGQQARLSQAALETLAVIAYRQPVARQQVAAVRGVNVDGVVRTLVQRGLVTEVGRDPGPGQAVLYGTTPAFLEQLGLQRLDQLPPLADYLPEGVELADLPLTE